MPILLTEEVLNNVKCYDYSIQRLPNGKDVLILMCEDTKGTNELNEILHSHPFDLKVFIKKETGNYELRFEFIDTDLVFSLTTGRNEETYPPVLRLKEQKIQFITTGVWGDDAPQGRMCEYHRNLFRLGEFDIAEAFQQASSVQFYGNENADQPSAVALIYQDWDHIFNAEADQAYNLLQERCVSMPKLEIRVNTDKTVDLRIWDILIDLDIKLTKLPYAENELDKFTIKAGSADSFAFVLGFPSDDPLHLGIVPSKREGFEIISLRGYVVKR